MRKIKIQPKPLKKYWIIVYSSGNTDYSTISYTKRQAIEKYVREPVWEKDKDDYWKKQYKKGVRCIKVNITFQIVEP